MIIYRPIMAKSCQITKKSSLLGGGYSNKTRATQFNPKGKRRRYVNLQTKSIFVPELNKKIVLTVSSKAIKTMQKNGVFSVLRKAKIV